VKGIVKYDRRQIPNRSLGLPSPAKAHSTGIEALGKKKDWQVRGQWVIGDE
jgi:hypothetical protein